MTGVRALRALGPLLLVALLLGASGTAGRPAVAVDPDGLSFFEEPASAATPGLAARPGEAAATASSVQTHQIPCRDTRGCPDLTVDAAQLAVGAQGEEHFPADSCAVEEGLVAPGRRHLLRLTFATGNQGDGSLLIGRPQDDPDHFAHSACHGHQHFGDFAHYRLWREQDFLAWDELRTANPHWTAGHTFFHYPELKDAVVAGHKQGFCLMDSAPALPSRHGHAVPVDPVPTHDCTNQGISRGWSDVYLFTLDGQWIDVTGLPPGPYVLEAETNPEHLFMESDYGNNRAVVPVAVLPPA